MGVNLWIFCTPYVLLIGSSSLERKHRGSLKGRIQLIESTNIGIGISTGNDETFDLDVQTTFPIIETSLKHAPVQELNNTNQIIETTI